MASGWWGLLAALTAFILGGKVIVNLIADGIVRRYIRGGCCPLCGSTEVSPRQWVDNRKAARAAQLREKGIR